MADDYQLEFVRKLVADLSVVQAELRVADAALVQRIEAFKFEKARDGSPAHTARFLAAEEAALRADAASAAQIRLEKMEFRDRLERAFGFQGKLKATLFRDGKFSSSLDPLTEWADRQMWVTRLPRARIGDLEALCDEAILTRRFGLAYAVDEEAGCRRHGPGGGGAEKAVATATAKALDAAGAPELAGHKVLFAELKTLGTSVAILYYGLLRPLTTTERDSLVHTGGLEPRIPMPSRDQADAALGDARMGTNAPLEKLKAARAA